MSGRHPVIQLTPETDITADRAGACSGCRPRGSVLTLQANSFHARSWLGCKTKCSFPMNEQGITVNRACDFEAVPDVADQG